MATIKDVAKLANVSVTTVSRVLNDKGYISEATRSAVYEAMKQLDYHPNEVARSLFRQQSKIIGLIIPTVSHPFFAEFARYVEFYADERGYKVMLCNSLLDGEKEKQYVQTLRRHQAEGVIVGSHTMEVDHYINATIPVVTFDRQIASHIPSIASDNYQGGVLAANHLIEMGCQHIAHISGSLQLNLLSNQRHDGFVKTCEENKIDYIVVQNEMSVLEHNDYESLIEALLMKHPTIDGIFASSDLIAAQAIQVCEKFSKSVPQDIKIIGYDDVNIAKYLTPSLTTIAQPIETMAKLTVETLINQINGDVVPTQLTLPVLLKVRKSAV